MDNGFIAKYHGIKIIVKPDKELTEIILPESMIRYIENLEKFKKEYITTKKEEILSE